MKRFQLLAQQEHSPRKPLYAQQIGGCSYVLAR